MEILGVVCLFVVVIPFVILGTKMSSDKRERLLKEGSVGLKGAQIEKNGFLFFSHLKLRFIHGWVPVTVSFESSGNKNKTYWMKLVVEHARVVPEMQLTQQGFFTELATSLLGIEDYLCGDGHFDSHFRIRGPSELAIQSSLSGPVRDAIWPLQTDLRILELKSTQFRFERRHWVKTAPELAELIQKTLACYDVMVQSQVDPFRALAKRTGLILEETNEPIGYHLQGVLESVPIRVAYRAWDLELRIEADLGAVVSCPAFSMMHASLPAQSFGLVAWVEMEWANPVMSRMVTVRASKAHHGRLQALFNRPGLAEGVLPVVHGFKGSVLTADKIDLVVKKCPPEEISTAFDAVSALIEVLKAFPS